MISTKFLILSKSSPEENDDFQQVARFQFLAHSGMHILQHFQADPQTQPDELATQTFTGLGTPPNQKEKGKALERKHCPILSAFILTQNDLDPGGRSESCSSTKGDPKCRKVQIYNFLYISYHVCAVLCLEK